VVLGGSLGVPMKRPEHAQSQFWVKSPDSVGNDVPVELIDAAQRVWDRARFVVIRYLADDSEAAEILERAVDAASRVQNGNGAISHIDAYLLKSVARESIRRQRKRPSLIPIPDVDLERLAVASDTNREQQFDDHRLMMLLRASLDPKGREMLEYRLLEFDWTAVASAVGYSNAHSAEVQFRKKLDQALARMQSHHGVRIKKPFRRVANA
jgi:hypothetical protein